MMYKTQTLIIGGGLSGLMLAKHLQDHNADYLLLEARERLGGRIKHTHFSDGHQQASFDLGPSWFWPGQERMLKLTEELQLKKFEQYSAGHALFEDESGVVSQGGYASMAGSYRLHGSIHALIEALSKSLDSHKIQLNTPIGRCIKKEAFIEVFLSEDTQCIARAKQVVLALPPRVASTLHFDPPLSQVQLSNLRTIPTWMGSQAKAIAIYAEPFWRKRGASGDAMSRKGPLVEIHDACDPDSTLGALFGFIGVPAQARKHQHDQLTQLVIAQLVRLFGEQAANPVDVIIQDWALESHTSTPDDLKPVYAHPRYGLPNTLKNVWDQQLFFSSTESAEVSGGYLEGALEAAARTADTLLGDRS